MLIGILIILVISILIGYFRFHISIGKDFSKIRNTISMSKDEYILLSDYQKFKSLNLDYNLKEKDFNDYEYLIFNTVAGSPTGTEYNFVPTGYDIKDGTLTIDITYIRRCRDDIINDFFYAFTGLSKRTFILRLKKDIVFKKLSYNYITRGDGECHTDGGIYKPMIYIYPIIDSMINVKLGYPKNLTVTYPKYNEGWNIYAKKDGTLIDSDGREYYGLYWESIRKNDIEFSDGFVVSKDDLIPFLEDKLNILGLNYREMNEFIVYWLPILQKNEYNLIRFATKEEINKEMPLEVTPKPDTLIRVWMEFEGLNSQIDIPEQQLSSVIRKGYTLVEWGGTEKSNLNK